MSFNSPSTPLPPLNDNPFNPTLASADPLMYAATGAGSWTQQEAVVVTNLLSYLSLDNDLVKNKDISKARKRYGSLDKDTKEFLKFLNPEADYQQQPKSIGRRILEFAGKEASEPFRSVLDSLEQFGKGVKSVYKLGVAADESLNKIITEGIPTIDKKTGQPLSTVEGFKKALTNKSWSDIYEGKNSWRDSSLEELENKYGYAASYLARKLIDGVKPSDILREYGEIDAPLTKAFQDFASQSDDWKKLYSEHKGQQINPGNDITNFLNKTLPPKDLGTVGDFIKNTVGTIPFIPVPVAEENTWAVKNINPFTFKEDEWASPSGQINFAYTILSDPLTWLTGGSTKSLMAGQQLAQQVYAGRTVERVAELFKNPQFNTKLSNISNDINELRAATEAKDFAQAGVIRTRIATLHPEYDNDGLINHLMSTKVLDDNLNEVSITDLNTMQKFFERGENVSFLTDLKINGIIQQRAHNIALERRTRAFTDKGKVLFDELVNGVDAAVLAGKKPIPKEATKTLEAWENFVLKDIDLNKIVQPDDITKTLTLQKNKLTKSYNKLFAKMPASKEIFHQDNRVYESADTFRQLTRFLVGDKLVANMLTQRYLSRSPEERLHTLKVMHNMYLDKIGLGSTPDGLTAKRAYLEGIFGSEFGLRPIINMTIPKHMDNSSLGSVDVGQSLAPAASQIFHTTSGISMIPFDDVLKETYDLKGGIRAGTLKQMAAFPTYNSGMRVIQTGWTGLVLLPKIAAKNAFDNFVIGTMVLGPDELISLFSGKGKDLSKTLQAYTANKQTQGMLKGRFLSLIKKNPAEYISSAERKRLRGFAEVEKVIELPSGTLVTIKKTLPLKDIFEGSVAERIASVAIAKYGNLSPQEAKWFTTFLTQSSHAIEGITQSSVAATFANQIVDGGMADEVFGKSSWAAALEAAGREQTGKYVIDTYNVITDANRVLAHMATFRQHFAFNKKGNVDFGGAFVENNGLKTADDVENYVTQLMGKVGWIKKDGKYVARGEGIKRGKNGQVIVDDKKSLESIRNFNGLFLKSSILKQEGKTEADVTESIIRGSTAELYNVFHGSSGKFNQDLLDLLKMKIQIVQKVLGKDVPGESKLEKALRLNNLKEQSTITYQIDNLTVDEFAQVTKDFPIEGTLKTDIDFQELGLTPESISKKLGDLNPWTIMDKQMVDLYSSDIYLIKVLQNRSLNQNAEKQMVKDIIQDTLQANKDEKIDMDVITAQAELQADSYFNNLAQVNAQNEVLQYIDNPAIKNQLDFNARVVGRFIRATNDYARRMVRYISQNPDKVAYRGGMYVHASNGSGMAYEDENGNKYILVPNDGVFWRNVAPVMASVANPLTAIGGVYRGLVDEDWSFFKQPEWNQYTAKISLLNPSYSEGAGVWSLVGPTMAIPTLATKALLTSVGQSLDVKEVVQFAENIDNWVLGPSSDNTNWVRALVPGSVMNAWAQIPGGQKTGKEANIIMQAAAGLQFNPATRVSGADLQDPVKMDLWYKRLRIAAHNIVAIQASVNTLFPVPLGTTQPDIPDALRKQGIVSLNQYWGEIIRGVTINNSENGFYLHDPIALATAMYIGENPDRLVYTVSKSSSAARVAINYTQETKNWAIGNKKLLERYPTVGWVFAPHVGEYDPNVMYFLEASDLIGPKNNPFDFQGKALKDYVINVTAAKDRYNYYKIDKDVNKLFTDPNNPDRNRATYRREILANADAQKKVLLSGNWALATALTAKAFEQRQTQLNKFASLESMVNDKDFIDKLPKEQVKTLQLMTSLSRRLLDVFEDTRVRTQFNGTETLDKEKIQGMANLENLSKGNRALTDAYESIIRPLLDEVYTTPTKVMEK
jgi:hypothetical protein